MILAILDIFATIPAGDTLAAARCSRIPFLVFGAKGMRVAYVLGTAAADTVLAGPATVQYDTGDGHFGRGPDRPIHGQQFIVSRIGSPTQLPPTVPRVVLVPWDYGPDCRPTPWGRSARWLETNEQTLIVGSLREPRYWANGIPTIDVSMLGPHPYPQHESSFRATEPALSADELFTLLEALPDAEHVDSAPVEAIVAFQRWAAANAGIARRWPADGSLAKLRHEGEMALLRKVTLPILGTFRFAVARPGRDSAVFFVRTDRRPTSVWHGRASAHAGQPTDVRLPDAYAIVVSTVTSSADLPSGDGHGIFGEIGFFKMINEPTIRANGSREWEGRVEFFTMERRMLPELSITDRPDELASLGRFVMDADGRVWVEMTIGRSAGRPITVRGERISTTVMDSKWIF
jgi:hypothetical protein